MTRDLAGLDEAVDRAAVQEGPEDLNGKLEAQSSLVPAGTRRPRRRSSYPRGFSSLATSAGVPSRLATTAKRSFS